MYVLYKIDQKNVDRIPDFNELLVLMYIKNTPENDFVHISYLDPVVIILDYTK